MARIRTVTPFNWSFERRFVPHVEKLSNGCWKWLGSKMRNGYGQMKIGGVHYAAHRYAYEQLRGPIPAGLELDHLCRNRGCTNPDHLEPVTHAENIRRGDTTRTFNSSKTHCPHGHEYTEENTAHRGRRRHCRACDRLRARHNRERANG